MAAVSNNRRSGRDRRSAGVALGKARGWLAALGMAVAGGGGVQLGQQRAETNMTQDSAKMLIHTRDREVDTLRVDTDRRFADVVHQIERIEDRMRCP